MRGKFPSLNVLQKNLNVFIREERFKSNDVSFHLKKVKDEQIKPKVSRKEKIIKSRNQYNVK